MTIFYETQANDHGLAFDPFKALVSPRPIGWIGTVARDGTHNLAPYSYFNAIGDSPKMIMFASDGKKDTVTNIEVTGEFTASLASRHLAEHVNASSVDAPAHEDEFVYAGLTAKTGRLVSAPFVAEAFAALECKLVERMRPVGLDGMPSGYIVVIGQVVGIHIDPEVVRDGRIDMQKAAPLARLGYRDYSDGSQTFEMTRPRWEESSS